MDIGHWLLTAFCVSKCNSLIYVDVCKVSSMRPSPRLVLFLFLVFVVFFAWYQLVGERASFQSVQKFTRLGKNLANTTSKNYTLTSLCHCGKGTARAEQPEDIIGAFEWCSPDSTARGKHQKVITYSVFGGTQSSYVFQRYYSLLNNISITAGKEYPGWVIRFYHNFRDQCGSVNVLKANYDQLCDVYCRYTNVDLCSVYNIIDRINSSETPVEPALIRHLNPRMFRFLVMLDPNVDVFISRDLDSFIWRREVDAVNQWLSSNYTFHVMRDHKNHTAIVLAGMWGVKLYQGRDVVHGLIKSLITDGQNQSKSRDQILLKKIVWPIAKNDVMAHDSYNCQKKKVISMSPLKVFPFPTKRIGNEYIGGVGGNLHTEKCPEACRPPDHKDWEYC